MRVLDVIEKLAASDAPTIVAPGLAALSGAGLHAEVQGVWSALCAAGCVPGHRVAVVGPSTAETAVLLLAICSYTTAIPLNPRLTPAEFAFSLDDLGVDMVLVHARAPRSAWDAAAQRGLPRWAYCAREGSAVAGQVGLAQTEAGRLQPPAGGPDRAFVLHTSGTTGKPKRVPLFHDRIMLSAANIARRLELGPGDRAASVMPLFHVHALGTVLLPTLLSGGSLFLGGDFAAQHFFGWLEESQATWYSAVPSIHHAVLARAVAEGRDAFRGSLRFVRSSSAPLPASLHLALEAFFDVPVIESYGMTEVEQICSGELPPAVRKPGSVGRPGGPEVIVTDDSGNPVPAGASGEVCVRGPNLFPGYDEDQAINEAAFFGEYFRTGDIGRFDDEGFLWLLGRSREIINRGGEKISPGEIEDAIMLVPGVVEAAAFGHPHAVLGQVPAAAVVTADRATFDLQHLRQALSRSLAPFKVPESIWLVDSLPKGPTGKLLRGKLRDLLVAEETGAGSSPSAAPVAQALEAAILLIWRNLAELETCHAETAFVDTGAESLLLAEFFEEVERLFDRPLPLEVMLSAQSVRDLASQLAELHWILPDEHARPAG